MDPTEPVDVIHLSLAGFRRREQRRSRGCHVKQERAPLASADWSFWRVAWRRGRLIPLKWCAWTYTTAVLKGQTKELCNVKRKNMMKIFEQRRNTAAYVLLKRRFSKVQIQCVCPKFVLFLLLLLWFPAFLNVLFFLVCSSCRVEASLPGHHSSRRQFDSMTHHTSLGHLSARGYFCAPAGIAALNAQWECKNCKYYSPPTGFLSFDNDLDCLLSCNMQMSPRWDYKASSSSSMDFFTLLVVLSESEKKKSQSFRTI